MSSGTGSSSDSCAELAKSYRLLRTILGTAVADEVIFRNPCTVKGAGVEHSPERPVATVAQVYELAAAVEPRYSALVLTAALTGCRWGELVGLTRRHLDLLHGTMTVAEALVEAAAGLSIGPPKSEAGRRMVALPPPLLPVLEEHLASFAQPGIDGLVFCGPKGAMLRRSNFSIKWTKARGAVGMEELHFHDPATYGEHPGRRHRSQYPGADAPHGPLLLVSRAALPGTPPGTAIRPSPRRWATSWQGKSRPRPRSEVTRQWHGRPPATDSDSVRARRRP